MFSGIIEETGLIRKILKPTGALLLEVEASRTRQETQIGESIAVNGVCLSVVKITADTLSFQVVPGTFEGTTLRFLKAADRVNLERSLKVGDRISGHFVTGHVDCVGLIRKRSMRRGSLTFEIAAPLEFSKYILPKGSIAIDGVSLTIAQKKSNIFSVNIIPHTATNTTLGDRGASSRVNIEFDILAKRASL